MMDLGSPYVYGDVPGHGDIGIARPPNDEFKSMFMNGLPKSGPYLNADRRTSRVERIAHYDSSSSNNWRYLPNNIEDVSPTVHNMTDHHFHHQQQRHASDASASEQHGRSLTDKHRTRLLNDQMLKEGSNSISNDSSQRNGSFSSNETGYPQERRTHNRRVTTPSMPAPVNYLGPSNIGPYVPPLPYQQQVPVQSANWVTEPTRVYAFLVPPNGMYPPPINSSPSPIPRELAPDVFGDFPPGLAIPNPLNNQLLPSTAMIAYPCYGNVVKVDPNNNNNSHNRHQPVPMTRCPHIAPITRPNIELEAPQTLMAGNQQTYWTGGEPTGVVAASDDFSRGRISPRSLPLSLQSLKYRPTIVQQQSTIPSSPLSSGGYGTQMISPQPAFDRQSRPPVSCTVTGTKSDSKSSDRRSDDSSKSRIDNIENRMKVIRPALLKIDRKLQRESCRNSSEEAIESVVIYWMVRELRTVHNHSLAYAQKVAIENGVALVVMYSPFHAPYPNKRQAFWRINGMVDVEEELMRCNIPLFSEVSSEWTVLKQILRNFDVVSIITDHFPLKEIKSYREQILDFLPLTTAFEEVDAHNVVPCWIASSKKESQPRTFRRNHRTGRATFKLQDLPPQLSVNETAFRGFHKFSHISDCLLQSKDEVLNLKTFQLPLSDDDVRESNWTKPGQKEGLKLVDEWCSKLILGYNKNRSNPHAQGTSKMSIYLNHGFISSQYALCEMDRYTVARKADKDRFINQILTWKELSDNLTYYNQDYDTTEVFPKWATTSLKHHEKDPRQWTYSYEELENCEVHDEVWIICQKELIMFGIMNPCLRLYWAKRIVEWTANITIALDIATRLNNKWALDGTDPVSYNGIAWSVGGTFDRGFECRNIYGRVRCASLRGVNLERWTKKVQASWESYQSSIKDGNSDWMRLYDRDLSIRSPPLDQELITRPDVIEGCKCPCIEGSSDSGENNQSSS